MSCLAKRKCVIIPMTLLPHALLDMTQMSHAYDGYDDIYMPRGAPLVTIRKKVWFFTHLTFTPCRQFIKYMSDMVYVMSRC